MSLHRVDTKRAAMFEDLPRNLVVPRALGMKTVLLVPRNLEYDVAEAWERADEADDQIDFITENLTEFLSHLV